MSAQSLPESIVVDQDSNLVLDSTNAVVHLEYEFETLPTLTEVIEAHGGGDWTRFVCISDTHGRRFDVPDGDVLLHSGDLTKHGSVAELEEAMDWIRGLPHKVKV